jgi:phosphoribosylamine--glycine ligase
MKVLLIGSGGREHALAMKIAESKKLERLFILPGNPGTAKIGENIDYEYEDHSTIVTFCIENKIDLVVIGPEKPLVDGLANALRDKKINVFGPNKEAAEIEAHKSFAKSIMKSAGVPTAGFIQFGSKMYSVAKEYLRNKKYPCVVKADGLAAGKGVFVCNFFSEADYALNQILVDKVFGESGEKVLIEEFLDGEEASVLAITDGEEFICLPASQDHKQIEDNDMGKNTGGMGAYAPAPIVTEQLMEVIKNKIIQPTLDVLRKENKKFIGCLYAGLMITKEGPKVVEFNCRFGDPEAQVVLPLLKGDFFELLYSVATGKLNKEAVSYSGGSAVCVVAASAGYPDEYKKGYEIKGLDAKSDNVIVFHAGTKEVGEKIITNGGRVLGVTAINPENNLAVTKEIAYKALANIKFDNIYYRNDIADKALKKDLQNSSK